jgi:hypothetical protein
MRSAKSFKQPKRQIFGLQLFEQGLDLFPENRVKMFQIIVNFPSHGAFSFPCPSGGDSIPLIPRLLAF